MEAREIGYFCQLNFKASTPDSKGQGWYFDNQTLKPYINQNFTVWKI